MLQHAWNQTNLFGRIHRDKSGGCSTEIVKAHGLSELPEDQPTGDVINAPFG
jgi:hypothetical protein